MLRECESEEQLLAEASTFGADAGDDGWVCRTRQWPTVHQGSTSASHRILLAMLAMSAGKHGITQF